MTSQALFLSKKQNWRRPKPPPFRQSFYLSSPAPLSTVIWTSPIVTLYLLYKTVTNLPSQAKLSLFEHPANHKAIEDL